MREAGLGEVSIQVPEGVDTVSPALMWDKTRHDLIVGYLDPIGCESFVDRTGQAIIQDRVTDPGLPLRDGDNATVVDVTSTKDWSAVINVVSAASTNTNVVLDPVIVSISDPEHPAHWSKFGATPEAGARVLRYTSQLIENYGDAFNAATAQLAKLSAPALSWTVTCIDDPTRMPGDLVTVTTDLGAIQATVEQVAHPLGAGEQKVTLGAVL
jgi:hypothetical protein